MTINTGRFLNGNELTIRIDHLDEKAISLYIDIPKKYKSKLTKYLSKNINIFLQLRKKNLSSQNI